jgi:hypothetical protein
MTHEEILTVLRSKAKDWNLSTFAKNIGYSRASLEQAIKGTPINKRGTKRKIPSKHLDNCRREIFRMSKYKTLKKNGKRKSE